MQRLRLAAIPASAIPASAIPASALVLAGIVSVQFGGALAAVLVRQLASLITVALRLDVAALILLAVARPSIRARSREAWQAAAILGISLAVMNLCFYSAIARLPLGVVVGDGNAGSAASRS